MKHTWLALAGHWEAFQPNMAWGGIPSCLERCWPALAHNPTFTSRGQQQQQQHKRRQTQAWTTLLSSLSPKMSHKEEQTSTDEATHGHQRARFCIVEVVVVCGSKETTISERSETSSLLCFAFRHWPREMVSKCFCWPKGDVMLCDSCFLCLCLCVWDLLFVWQTKAMVFTPSSAPLKPATHSPPQPTPHPSSTQDTQPNQTDSTSIVGEDKVKGEGDGEEASLVANSQHQRLKRRRSPSGEVEGVDANNEQALTPPRTLPAGSFFAWHANELCLTSSLMCWLWRFLNTTPSSRGLYIIHCFHTQKKNTVVIGILCLCLCLWKETRSGDERVSLFVSGCRHCVCRCGWCSHNIDGTVVHTFWCFEGGLLKHPFFKCLEVLSCQGNCLGVGVCLDLVGLSSRLPFPFDSVLGCWRDANDPEQHKG